MKPSGVKGVKSMGINSPPGKDQHVQQVSPNRHPATVSINGTKGIKFIGTDPSPGNERHERQLSPDRHPANVHIKQKIIPGAWNVRTLNNLG